MKRKKLCKAKQRQRVQSRCKMAIVCMILLFCLIGCEEDESANPSATPSDAVTEPVDALSPPPSGDLDFNLTPQQSPNFSSETPLPTPNVGTTEPLYTIVDGYAYRLDDTTLEPVGGPLDPLTHEPIATETPSAEIPPSETPPVDEAEATPVPKEDRLPNTGIFEEDD